MSRRPWLVRRLNRVLYSTWFGQHVTRLLYRRAPRQQTVDRTLSRKQRRKFQAANISLDDSSVSQKLRHVIRKRIKALGAWATRKDHQFSFGILKEKSIGRITDLGVRSSSLWNNSLSSFRQFKQLEKLWNKSSASHFNRWIHGLPREHFGPKARVTDLFVRRDTIYYHLASQNLRWHVPPPKLHHDVFDVALRVSKVEEAIGYIFKNRMLCVEALKMSGLYSPLWFGGTVVRVVGNNRLALVGDRALSMAICGLWWKTGNSTKQYAKMLLDTETRASLAITGRRLGVDKSILLPWSVKDARSPQIAETVEAILGAVYIDSGNQLPAVTKVIKNIGLDQHKLLQVPGDPKQELAGAQGVTNAAGISLRDPAEDEEFTAVVEQQPPAVRGVSSGGG